MNFPIWPRAKRDCIASFMMNQNAKNDMPEVTQKRGFSFRRETDENMKQPENLRYRLSAGTLLNTHVYRIINFLGSNEASLVVHTSSAKSVHHQGGCFANWYSNI